MSCCSPSTQSMRGCLKALSTPGGFSTASLLNHNAKPVVEHKASEGRGNGGHVELAAQATEEQIPGSPDIFQLHAIEIELEKTGTLPLCAQQSTGVSSADENHEGTPTIIDSLSDRIIASCCQSVETHHGSVRAEFDNLRKMYITAIEELEGMERRYILFLKS
ncbi:hypothetical protein CVT26_004828 [Gymnopilus dilepis]|uniref:Uncharacterized protein n=1 Tax=Gymnopilus dilepis TaxID=231916 RepID=A0A409XZI4_9AGAR|nr:hypothetical protein CVT26_004828 [Gymnopilus dilepis]